MRRNRWILVVATIAFVALAMSLPGTADARRWRGCCNWDCCDPCGTVSCCNTGGGCAVNTCDPCGTCRTARYQTYSVFYGGCCGGFECAPVQQQESTQTFAPPAPQTAAPQMAPPPAAPAAGTHR